MSSGWPYNLLAEGNWLELLVPVFLMLIYGGAALVRMFAERSKQSGRAREDVSSASAAESEAAPRYKPLDAVARPRPETPQARTLPYARTVSRDSSAPAGRETFVGQTSEWDRQQEIKQRRLEKIEALRQQKLREQQVQRQRQQQQLLQQRQQQAAQRAQAQAATAGAVVRKTPQEALRQVQTGRPVGSGLLSRKSVLKPPAAVSGKGAGVSRQVPAKASAADFSCDTLRVILQTRDGLRAAVVLKEILDKPLGFR